jgi:hypothetical protein
MAAWTTVVKINFDRISRLQDQALRIITAGMRSTPINALEKNHTFVKDRRDMKTQVQAEKLKRIPHHPMYQRINGYGQGRLKRSNFTETTRKHFKAVSSRMSIMATAMKDTTKLSTWRRFF